MFMISIGNTFKKIGHGIGLSRDLIDVPASHAEFQHSCEALMRSHTIGAVAVVLLTSVTLVLFLFWGVPVLLPLIAPLLLHPFIAFMLILQLVFSSLAFVRLRWLSKFDMTALAWVTYATLAMITCCVSYVYVATDYDVILTLVVCAPLELFAMFLSRFLFLGWRLLRTRDIQARRAG